MLAFLQIGTAGSDINSENKLRPAEFLQHDKSDVKEQKKECGEAVTTDLSAKGLESISFIYEQIYE